MARVSCAHHVFGIEHLLGELRDSESTVLLRSTRCQGCEASHEEVQARERNEVHGDLTKIAVELSGEAETASHSTHGCTHQVVQISVSGCCELQCSEADVIQSFVIQQEAFVRIL